MKTLPWARWPGALLLVLGLAHSGAGAAKLPDWASTIADAAPEAPAGVPENPSRVLFSETRYAVHPDGSYEIRRRLALQALSVKTESVGTGWFPFSEAVKVTASRAWHLPPDDKAKKSRSKPMDIAVGQAFLTGSKARVLPVLGVKKGSLVFFEFEATEKPLFLTLTHVFFEDAPVTSDRLELSTPPGWKVRWAWLHRKGPEPVVSGDLRSWEIRDIPAPESEPMGPAPLHEAALLAVNLLPPPGASVAPASFADWSSMGRWYEELSRGRDEATPPIQAAWKQARPAGDQVAAADRIRAAGLLVRDRVRYVAVELGIGGYQPRAASETLTSLYGDCKDKGTLFRSFLSAEGLPSYPILVNVTIPDAIPDDPPVFYFDHFVVGVPTPAETKLPDSMASAVVDAGDLGKLLIVDTTDAVTSIGSISSALAGKRALVAAGARSRLVTLPNGTPSMHRLERRLQMELLSDRAVALERTSTYSGQFAATVRSEANVSSRERRKAVEHWMQDLWPEALVQDYSVDKETSRGEFVEMVKLKHGPVPASGPSARVELFPGASQDVDRVPLTRRKTAVLYSFPRTVRYDTTLKGLPEGWMPDPQSLAGAGWTVQTTYAREGEVIHATWELQLSRTRFDPEAFPELRKLWSAVAATSAWDIPLSN
jgi:uncharacterized protein DUF3857